jgi:hypothetical protein
MAKTRKEGLLESLDGIEDDLQLRKGKEAFAGKETPAEEKAELEGEESANTDVPSEGKADTGSVAHEAEDPVEGDVVKEVEEHEVASGQWDCPHCGESMKVKEA